MTYQMRPSDLVHGLSIVQLDVQVLVHALQCPANLDFVLEFDCDLVLDERFEETAPASVCCLCNDSIAWPAQWHRA